MKKEQNIGFDPQELLEIFRKQTNVQDRVDLQSGNAMEIWRKLKPLADRAANDDRLSVQEHAMLAGLGESTDGLARGIASDRGLTLEETFNIEGTDFMRSLYWNPATPDNVEIYSMKRHGGFAGMSRAVHIPLDGDMAKISFGTE
ncbi:hypothetical protein KBD75_01035 [Candidatus Woesebacteria bacterium]|nr:hypothetical protein [Candidatus Woesebacteria bacterium]